MNSRFSEYLVAAVAVALLLYGAGDWLYDAGRTKERLVWQEREVETARAFGEKLAAEVKRGKAASADLQGDLANLQTTHALLQGEYRELLTRVPLVLPRTVSAVRDDRRGGGAADGQSSANGDAATADAQQPADGSGDRLSRGAVWMWNSALAGVDVPAGSCGLADTSSEACAADSGLTVADAWANHNLNATSCAADRVRHRALIEFITEGAAE